MKEYCRTWSAVVVAIALLLSLMSRLEAHDLLSTTEMEHLKAQLEKVAGVYEDAALVQKHQLQKTVLVTGCNHGFLNHLFNFDCFAQRLGMKYLVVTMDASAESFLTSHTSMVTFPMLGSNDIGTESSEFRSKQFNLITARKKAAVHSIMQLGYDVLFSDTDVALLRDPFPYLRWKNVDYVHSLNYHCDESPMLYESFWRSRMEGNTGFYYVRSTPQTLQLWADAFAAAPKFPKLDDQAVFWTVIRRSTNPPAKTIGKCRHFDTPSDLNALAEPRSQAKYLVSCILDVCMFNSGALSRFYVPEQTYERVLQTMRAHNDSVVSVHANYISGNKKKMQRMQEHHLWLAEYDDIDTLSKRGDTTAPAADGKRRAVHRCLPYKPLPHDWKYPELQPLKPV